jgi:hypothetical protein
LDLSRVRNKKQLPTKLEGPSVLQPFLVTPILTAYTWQPQLFFAQPITLLRPGFISQLWEDGSSATFESPRFLAVVYPSFFQPHPRKEHGKQSSASQGPTPVTRVRSNKGVLGGRRDEKHLRTVMAEEYLSATVLDCRFRRMQVLTLA